MNGEPFKPVTLSSINQNLWLGYYIQNAGSDRDAATVNTLELKVTSATESTFSEELKLTNFSQDSFAFEFALEIDADFADQKRLPHPIESSKALFTSDGIKAPTESHTLVFNYAATHDYDQQGEASLLGFIAA